MPIIKSNSPAVRVIKGEGASGNQSAVDFRGNPANREFIRVYYGDDLKFDRLSGYFQIRNTASAAKTFQIKTTGTWTKPNLVMLNTATYTESSISYNSNITVPANGTVYIRNASSSDAVLGSGLSKSNTQYMYFYSTASDWMECGGSWDAFVPYNEDGQKIIHPYAFYKLFFGCAAVKSVPDWDNIATGANMRMSGSTSAFESCFEGATRLTRSPKITIAGFRDQAAFKNFAANCTSLTSAGDLIINGGCYEQSFYNSFYGCSSLTTAPVIGSWSGYTGDLLTATVSGSRYETYQTFKGCASIVNLSGIIIIPDTVPEYSMYGMFQGCSSFTNSLDRIRTDSYNWRHWHNENEWIVGPGQSYDPDGRSSDSYLEVEKYGMAYMFQGCSSLTVLPNSKSVSSVRKLIISPRGEYALYEAFADCASVSQSEFARLRIHPKTGLGINYAADYVCASVFRACASITDATSVFDEHQFANTPFYSKQDTDLAGFGYFYSMFTGCSALLSAKLPVTNDYSVGCTDFMRGMFYGCANLATCSGVINKAVSGSTDSMFQGCAHLSDAPIIDMPTIPAGALVSTFRGCSVLNKIYINTSTDLSSSVSNSWTYGLPASGTFYKLNGGWTFNTKNASGNTTNPHFIPYNWTISSGIIFRSSSQFTVSLRLVGSALSGRSFYYRLSTGTTEQSYAVGTTVTVPAGGFLVFRGTSATGVLSSESSYYKFTVTSAGGNGSVYCSGNMVSLCANSGLIAPLNYNYCFQYLFSGCSALAEGPDFKDFGSSHIEKKYTYFATYLNCAGLLTAPMIPDDTVDDYEYRQCFRGCSSLSQMADHTNITGGTGEGSFYEMYRGTAVTKMNSITGGTFVAIGKYCCYGMFMGCTSLRSAEAVLRYTALNPFCYQRMFYGCTSLVSLPDGFLPATSPADMCYTEMFRNCTSLIKAPHIKFTDTGQGSCLSSMFYNCSSLDEIHVYFNSWRPVYWASSTERDTRDWVRSVPASLRADGTHRQFYAHYSGSTLPHYVNNSTNTGNTNNLGDGCSDTSACFIPYNWTVTDVSEQDTTPFPSDWLILTPTTPGQLPYLVARQADLVQYNESGNPDNWVTMAANSQKQIPSRGLALRVGPSNGSQHKYLHNTTAFEITAHNANLSGDALYLVTRYPAQWYNTINIDLSNSLRDQSYIKDCSNLSFSNIYGGRFASMFEGSGVTKVQRHLIDNINTALYEDAFSGMFRNCYYLTQGCNLFSGTGPSSYRRIGKYQFHEMYQNCASLSSPNNSNRIVIGGYGMSIDSADMNGSYYSWAYQRAFENCSGSNFNSIQIYRDKLNNGNGASGIAYDVFEDCFNQCSNLSTIYAHFDQWPSNIGATWHWVNGVSNSGVFYRYHNIGTAQGPNRIPSGWSSPLVS